jgi:hypothetical protein
MATVSTIRLTVDLLDCAFVDSLDPRFLYRDSPYSIALTVLNGEAGLTTGIKLYDEDGEYLDLAGTDTDADGRATITIDDEIDFDGAYTCLICVNGSKAAEFPLEVKAIGSPVPPTGTVLDWNAITTYIDTATKGPVRAGTGITNTVNADGSNTHSLAAHAATHGTGGSDPVTAADVDPAGTAIAAALGNKADTTALYIDGTQPSGATQGNIKVKNLATGQVQPAALGVGAVDLQHVRDTNTKAATGSGSFAAGSNNTASGAGAVALGDAHIVSALRGAAVGGRANTVSHDGIALSGEGNTVSGEKAVALGGALNTASGVYAVASGTSSTASGPASIAEGVSAQATGTLSRASGRKAEALHDGAVVLVDNQDAVQASTAANQLTERFAGGYRFFGGNALFEGTILAPPIVQNGNVTAEKDAVYHNVGNSVYTDPTVPAEGRGYTVVVVNGTATVNGVGYAVAGTVIRRMWHSGAWQTARVYLPHGKSITESGTTRTIGRGDVGQLIRLTNAGACTITVPANSTTAFEDGDTVYFRVTTVSPAALTLGADVVVNNGAAVTSLPAESSFALRRTATVNVWDLI